MKITIDDTIEITVDKLSPSEDGIWIRNLKLNQLICINKKHLNLIAEFLTTITGEYYMNSEASRRFDRWWTQEF